MTWVLTGLIVGNVFFTLQNIYYYWQWKRAASNASDWEKLHDSARALYFETSEKVGDLQTELYRKKKKGECDKLQNRLSVANAKLLEVERLLDAELISHDTTRTQLRQYDELYLQLKAFYDTKRQ